MLDDHRCIFCAAGRHCMDGLEDHADSQPAERSCFCDGNLFGLYGAGTGYGGTHAGDAGDQRSHVSDRRAGTGRFWRRRYQTDGGGRPVSRLERNGAGGGAGDFCRWNLGIVSGTI